VRPAVVGGGERAEALLAGGVPHRELDALRVHGGVLHLEVHADGGLDVLVIGVVAEAEKQLQGMG
jgi:hypothetical protein